MSKKTITFTPDNFDFSFEGSNLKYGGQVAAIVNGLPITRDKQNRQYGKAITSYELKVDAVKGVQLQITYLEEAMNPEFLKKMVVDV